MTHFSEAESGSELFRGSGEDHTGWDIGFGPVSGGGVRWSLYAVSGGLVVDCVVLDVPRPSRQRLWAFLAEITGDAEALELLGRIGRLGHFYRSYYAARPDLDRRYLFAVA